MRVSNLPSLILLKRYTIVLESSVEKITWGIFWGKKYFGFREPDNTKANPILYRLAALGLLKTPRGAGDWVKSGLTSIEVRLKETQTS